MEKKILIINANYYQDISDRLVAGATNYLKENGIDYKVVNVPGAL
jgi:Riboflavin synthase beta-chain